MFCQKCGKELPDDAKFCQYCGWQNQENNKERNINNSQNNNGLGCMGCFGIAFVIIFIILMLIPEKPIENDSYAQELLARTLCQQEVQSRLKNPKSAEFNRSEDVTEKIENMHYKVESTLYAQNSFGTNIKTYYSCKVKINDKESGDVYDVKIK